MVIPSAAEFFTVRKMAVKSERKTERERVLSCKIVGTTQPYIKQRNDTLCKLFTTQASQIRLDKKQRRATDDVVIGKYLRNGMHQPQNEPYQCLDEPVDRRETRKPARNVVHGHVNDESD